MLFERFTNFSEGKLTKLRATITRQESLVDFAHDIDLGTYLRLGKGEFNSDGQNRPSNLCDAFEALIGAVYIDDDCQLANVRRIVLELVDQNIPDIEGKLIDDNPKGMLQELVQNQHQEKPVYNTIKVEGPDHERLYTVSVSIKGEEMGQGEANKLRAAEQNAAREALKKLKPDNDA